MVLGPALADVVQQERDIEHPPVQPGLEDAAGDRKLLDKLALLDAREVRDALNGVLVDGVGMIHVELHHRHDGGEFRQECREHAELVHPPERALGVAVLQEQVEKDPVGFGCGPHLVVDELKIVRNEPHRIGMQKQRLPQADLEDPQHVELVFEKGRRVRDIQPVVDDLVAVRHLPAASEHAQHVGGRLDVPRLEAGEQDPREIAHRGGVAEIILHEVFHRPPPAAVLVPEPRGHLDLHVEGELVGGPPRDQMELGADREQEILRGEKRLQLALAEHARRREVLDRVRARDVLGDPEQRLEVPETALALPPPPFTLGSTM